MNYYNEFDPFAASLLRELIKAKLIPQGEVDERSITEIIPADLRGYTQCHFFAGIGGWSLALQLAGWPTDRPVWTGSCPCQPFSSAGKQKGKADKRHLWPVWHSLIKECKPQIIFGEQVASSEIVGTELETSFAIAVQRGDHAAANRIANKLVKQTGFGFTSRWLDDVYQGLEAEGYAVGSAVLPACSVGAPHKRDRLFFVGDNDSQRCDRESVSIWQEQKENIKIDRSGKSNVGYAEHNGSHGGQVTGGDGEAICDNAQGQDSTSEFTGTSQSCDVVCATGVYAQRCKNGSGQGQYWGSGTWIDCPDGKQRLIEPSIPLLAHGVPNRVGRLRGYGNAIVPQVAAEFIKAYMEV